MKVPRRDTHEECLTPKWRLQRLSLALRAHSRCVALEGPTWGALRQGRRVAGFRTSLLHGDLGRRGL
ncbi:hypothetical protein NDU88_001722 [Pleurodeles waltl]|uniref:Uncharacterized protein n=1 Tax=Pleurodeles waltl TaxID=8319 RepID=A0AAV7Q6V3_PLEWA|nr:hypothetical protein NDU88_001722 [Pleurodeles waltl]